MQMRNYIMSKIEKRKPTYKLPFKLIYMFFYKSTTVIPAPPNCKLVA